MYENWFPTLSTGTTNCRNLATENAGGNAGRATGCVSNASAITNAVSCVTSAPSRVARWSNQTVYLFTDFPLFFLDIFFGISAELSRMTESMVILASTLSTRLNPWKFVLSIRCENGWKWVWKSKHRNWTYQKVEMLQRKSREQISWNSVQIPTKTFCKFCKICKKSPNFNISYTNR